jgi:G3E family GTPase
VTAEKSGIDLINRGLYATKTTIVCGLLGAGKTTFIRQFVKNAQGKSVVLVNDFGRAGIDGEIFSVDGIESIELPNGCVCCSLQSDLIAIIQRVVKNISPEHLLIEPSGVASPSGVLEALDVLKIAPVTVIGIVDATEFVDLHTSAVYGSFFEDQILNSDLILVNKTDLAAEEMVNRTVGLIAEMNPKAIIFRTVNAAADEDLPSLFSNECRFFKGHRPHFPFESISLRLSSKIGLSAFKNFFEALAEGMYGNVVRAKALVQTDKGPFSFDLSSGRVDHRPFGEAISDGRLVIIGEDLREDILSAAAKSELGVQSISWP